jgi:hypothetical protein
MAASPPIGKMRIYKGSDKRAEERRRITGYPLVASAGFQGGANVFFSWSGGQWSIAYQGAGGSTNPNSDANYWSAVSARILSPNYDESMAALPDPGEEVETYYNSDTIEGWMEYCYQYGYIYMEATVVTDVQAFLIPSPSGWGRVAGPYYDSTSFEYSC